MGCCMGCCPGWYRDLDITNIDASLRSWFSDFLMTEAFSANVTLNGNHFSSKNHSSSPSYVHTTPRVGLVKCPGQPSALITVRSICCNQALRLTHCLLVAQAFRYGTTIMTATTNFLGLKQEVVLLLDQSLPCICGARVHGGGSPPACGVHPPG
jgi:hypothetical protein